MRIDGLGRAFSGGGAARQAASGAFRLSDPVATETARQAPPTLSAQGLGALLALQAEEETPRERRRRAVRRGRGLLDALDGLRLALVEGRADAQLLAGMAQNLAGRCGQTGDAALDDTLSAIEVRAQVELAKRGL
ncbi:flagellar assembly protein FliX [Hansschlegelia beijingensis]|uniref:Flagellar assembly regulator FliX n=1 Tax=Hansschlegelia beijingensis TaxID=1133344 RepID=A0A7W6GFX5_9HYPH|nr:flagellar assembly protein FliX [Hansschlegelia beijingensis]MBB3973518.1 hypothetical protein [Hansschlegelia beijingensis]